MEEELKQRLAQNNGISVDDIQISEDGVFTILGRTYRYVDGSIRLITDEENPEVTETDKNVADTIAKYLVNKDMKEELKKDLKRSYDLAKVLAAAKWLSEDMEGKAEDVFDYALLTISMFEAGEDESKAEPVLQVRVRKDGIDAEEEFVVVSATVGFTNTTDDIEKKIDDLGSIIETVTEELLYKFPDDVLVYRWLEEKVND